MLNSTTYGMLLFLLQLLHQTCYAANNDSCVPSSCGHLRDNSYPFRLKTDPSICGLEEFELTCEDNIPVVQFSELKFYVKEINYNNFTIRLSHTNVLSNDYCSLPNQSSTSSCSFLFPGVYDSYSWLVPNSMVLYQSIVFLTCPKPVISPLYVNTSPCYITYNATFSSSVSNLKLKGHSYVKIGPDYVKDLEPLCTINRIYVTSLFGEDVKYVSYADIRQSLVYGFELSFFYSACCPYYPENRCKLDAATMAEYYCSTGISIIQYGYLRSLLLKLEKTALGRILIRLKWNPPLYYDLGECELFRSENRFN
ncbi:hypothetical protein JCGZ_18814 [Jatropha curcas]|uniref:Wall-associated receptor kinase galacturonan-binding domain-containing protein n=1 Tax=Jatropha curcas TaxID=180498 RepID=A0A067K0I0_JATCU|nr:hypothetical protein JCGZ_18814 [Jatropha curcas]